MNFEEETTVLPASGGQYPFTRTLAITSVLPTIHLEHDGANQWTEFEFQRVSHSRDFLRAMMHQGRYFNRQAD
jgi:hypothetical protein